MKKMKLVCLTIVQLVKQVCRVPQMIVNAGKQRQRQVILNKREAERLDRICNPSKYRGKVRLYQSHRSAAHIAAAGNPWVEKGRVLPHIRIEAIGINSLQLSSLYLRHDIIERNQKILDGWCRNGR